MQFRTDVHPPFFERFELKVVKGLHGYHPFLLGMYRSGGGEPLETDLLPLDTVPPMRTYQDAEELGLVVIWQNLQGKTDLDGNPLSPLV